jgi:Protein of unknown function (DUF1566)
MKIYFAKGLVASLLALFYVVPGLACDKPSYEVLGEGHFLRDTRTGLIWQRCVIGQVWDASTCRSEDKLSNIPGKLLTYREAMREALRQNERSTDPLVQWRVPTEAELRTLALPSCAPSTEAFFDLKWFPSDRAWDDQTFLWFAGPFDLKRGVQVMRVRDTELQWVGYGDQVLHHLRLVR